MGNEKEVLDSLVKAILLSDSDRLKKALDEAMSSGLPVDVIIREGLGKGMEQVGEKYESGEYFLSELLFAGTLMNSALELLQTDTNAQRAENQEIIVLGTVKGDIHDIGKNIFKMLASASGFNVHDLGVDVDVDTFAREIKETHGRILGMSSLLTTTRPEMKQVIVQLTPRTAKVVIGGNAVTKDFAREIGADEAALNAVEGIEICEKWTATNLS